MNTEDLGNSQPNNLNQSSNTEISFTSICSDQKSPRNLANTTQISKVLFLHKAQIQKLIQIQEKYEANKFNLKQEISDLNANSIKSDYMDLKHRIEDFVQQRQKLFSYFSYLNTLLDEKLKVSYYSLNEIRELFSNSKNQLQQLSSMVDACERDKNESSNIKKLISVVSKQENVVDYIIMLKKSREELTQSIELRSTKESILQDKQFILCANTEKVELRENSIGNTLRELNEKQRELSKINDDITNLRMKKEVLLKEYAEREGDDNNNNKDFFENPNTDNTVLREMRNYMVLIKENDSKLSEGIKRLKQWNAILENITVYYIDTVSLISFLTESYEVERMKYLDFSNKQKNLNNVVFNSDGETNCYNQASNIINHNNNSQLHRNPSIVLMNQSKRSDRIMHSSIKDNHLLISQYTFQSGKLNTNSSNTSDQAQRAFNSNTRYNNSNMYRKEIPVLSSAVTLNRKVESLIRKPLSNSFYTLAGLAFLYTLVYLNLQKKLRYSQEALFNLEQELSRILLSTEELDQIKTVKKDTLSRNNNKIVYYDSLISKLRSKDPN